MKNPRSYTLGEIETILQVNPEYREQYVYVWALSDLFMFLERYENDVKNFQVKRERAEISKSRPLPRRRCQSLDVDLLDSCTLIDAGL